MNARAILTMALAAMAAARAIAQEPPPQRHLVYTFATGIRSDTHAVAVAAPQLPAGGAMGGASNAHVNDQAPATSKTPGASESSGVSSDRGTLNVDVFAPQADGGLHVRITEVRNERNGAPTDCIVYPSTSVTCAARISPEAGLILSTLSPQFFQPAILDAKNHWHESADTPGLSLDFTASAPKGSIIWITEERNQKVSSGNATINGTAVFTYDTAKRVTTDLKDHETVQRGESGQTSNLTIDTTATLTSDSGTTTKS